MFLECGLLRSFRKVGLVNLAQQNAVFVWVFSTVAELSLENEMSKLLWIKVGALISQASAWLKLMRQYWLMCNIWKSTFVNYFKKFNFEDIVMKTSATVIFCLPPPQHFQCQQNSTPTRHLCTRTIRVKENTQDFHFQGCSLELFLNNLEAVQTLLGLSAVLRIESASCFLIFWKCSWISESSLQYLTKCNYFC